MKGYFEMVCNGSSLVKDKQIRLTSHFLIKSIFVALRSGCSGLNGLIQLQMMTSLVASPGHLHPQYCSNAIHSVYNH